MLYKGTDKREGTYNGFQVIEANFNGFYVSRECVVKAASDSATFIYFVRCLDVCVEGDGGVTAGGETGMFKPGMSVKISNTRIARVHGVGWHKLA
jgi:hypothetical protein